MPSPKQTESNRIDRDECKRTQRWEKGQQYTKTRTHNWILIVGIELEKRKKRCDARVVWLHTNFLRVFFVLRWLHSFGFGSVSLLFGRCSNAMLLLLLLLLLLLCCYWMFQSSRCASVIMVTLCTDGTIPDRLLLWTSNVTVCLFVGLVVLLVIWKLCTKHSY